MPTKRLTTTTRLLQKKSVFAIDALARSILGTGVSTSIQFNSSLQLDGWYRAESDNPTSLTYVWVERQSVLVNVPNKESFVIFPGSVAVLDAKDGLEIKPVSSGVLPWVYCVQMPTTDWLKAILLKPSAVAHVALDIQHTYPAIHAVRNATADMFTSGMIDRASQIAPRADHEFAQFVLSNLMHSIDASPVAQLLCHNRLGSALSTELYAEGPSSSIDDVASACAMSRSTFSTKFRKLTGQSYLTFMTSWRMNLSRMRFQWTKSTVAQEAQRYGYQSEAAYRKAFTRSLGVAPGFIRHLDNTHSKKIASASAAQTSSHSKNKPHDKSESRAKNAVTQVLSLQTQADIYDIPPDLQSLIAKLVWQL